MFDFKALKCKVLQRELSSLRFRREDEAPKAPEPHIFSEVAGNVGDGGSAERRSGDYPP